MHCANFPGDLGRQITRCLIAHPDGADTIELAHWARRTAECRECLAAGALDQTDMAILRGIKESLPAANSESPQAVLEFVRDAVRAATAKTIESTE
jgi:hypothetical protein